MHYGIVSILLLGVFMKRRLFAIKCIPRNSKFYIVRINNLLGAIMQKNDNFLIMLKTLTLFSCFLQE